MIVVLFICTDFVGPRFRDSHSTVIWDVQPFPYPLEACSPNQKHHQIQDVRRVTARVFERDNLRQIIFDTLF